MSAPIDRVLARQLSSELRISDATGKQTFRDDVKAPNQAV
jgi:hypothetical protein